MKKKFYVPIVILTFCISFSSFFGVAFADKSARELEQDIKNRTSELKKLEEQAEKIRREIAKTGSQKASLKRELALIQKQRLSLENTIKQTRSKISLLGSQISKKEQQIKIQQNSIKQQMMSIEKLLRRINYLEKGSLLEFLFQMRRFSTFFSEKDAYELVQPEILSQIKTLKGIKHELNENIKTLSEKQHSLEEEKEKLSDQNKIVLSQAQKKQEIIKQTKNKESLYQQNLKKTLQNIKKLDREIRNYESQLKFILNKKSLPKKGSAPFAWPLKKVLITQRFGKTTASGRLYKSGSHSGMDFRAAIGTPVYATADGLVKGVGNTDLTCPRASFGKWIFIEHSFGLSSTFGHLSKIKVREGQRVREGDLIGYSGNTGRTTAPHLHVTVYATHGAKGRGVRIVKRPSGACPGKSYRMPLAPTAAYLDPLVYFPKASTSMFKHPSLAGA